jgi:AcrR family transcriptional regulator
MAATKLRARPQTKQRKSRVPRNNVRAPRPYHHGALPEALLQAAERILRRDGIQALTLRAAAREAGVSHAAPKNHFGDLSGLLSELAAVGFRQFTAMMLAGSRDNDPPQKRMEALGRGYVAFARAHPDLFLLMFRSERLDMMRPTLREAADQAGRVLAEAVATKREEKIEQGLTLGQAAGIVGAWSLVHGFAMLLLDGRLKTIMARLPSSTTEDRLLGAIFSALQANQLRIPP